MSMKGPTSWEGYCNLRINEGRLRMDTEAVIINLVGYSAHHKPFVYRDQKKGINTYLFRLQTQGAAKARIGESMQTITPGELLLYQPGDPYELEIWPPAELEEASHRTISCDYYVFCSGSWVDTWWAQDERPARTKIPSEGRLVTIWDQLARERYTNDSISAALSTYLLKTLCLMIDRAIRDSQIQRRPSTAFLVHAIREYIEEHAVSGFTVKDVADHVGLSTSRVMHLFKDSFGVTISQYTLDIKLGAARQQIAVYDMTLEEVALQCGFPNYSYFYRVFVERYKVTPKEFRALNR